MQTTALNLYAQIQQQIENLNEIELIEVIDFIGFLQQKRSQKQRRLDIFKELQTKNVDVATLNRTHKLKCSQGQALG